MEIRSRQCSFMFSGRKIEMMENANRNRNEEEEVENGATTVSNNNIVLSTSCRIRQCSHSDVESTYFMYTHKCVTLHIYIDATAHKYASTHISKSKNTFTQWMRRESPQSRLTCILFFFIDTSNEFSCTKNRIIVYTLEYTHFTTLTAVSVCLSGYVCVCAYEWARIQTSSFMAPN